MSKRVLVTGASGFVGRSLTPALESAGHEVRAMTRRPDDYTGAGKPVFGDVEQPDSLAEALRDVEVAYYFVHSLDSEDFESKDAEAALQFRRRRGRGRRAPDRVPGRPRRRRRQAVGRTCVRGARSSSCSAWPACR